MPTAAKSRAKSRSILLPGDYSLPSKILSFALFVASTLLMLDMREALNAAHEGDQSDAVYIHGL